MMTEMTDDINWPPPYSLRKSKRAKKILLKISRRHGVEIVVPYWARAIEALHFLDEQRAWITKQLQKHQFQVNEQPLRLPAQIELRCLSQTWQVTYVASTSKASYVEQPEQQVAIRCDVDNHSTCLRLLTDWLRSSAERILLPWLERISQQTGLDFKSAKIRGQKTRWGSCTSAKVINLNYKLLFLPPHLVEHILLHELCHTVHLNHSRQFWQLVAKHNSGWSQHEKEVRRSLNLVPVWLE